MAFMPLLVVRHAFAFVWTELRHSALGCFVCPVHKRMKFNENLEKSAQLRLVFCKKVIPLHADYYQEGIKYAFGARVDSLSFGRDGGP